MKRVFIFVLFFILTISSNFAIEIEQHSFGGRAGISFVGQPDRNNEYSFTGGAFLNIAFYYVHAFMENLWIINSLSLQGELNYIAMQRAITSKNVDFYDQIRVEHTGFNSVDIPILMRMGFLNNRLNVFFGPHVTFMISSESQVNLGYTSGLSWSIPNSSGRIVLDLRRYEDLIRKDKHWPKVGFALTAGYEMSFWSFLDHA